MRVVSWRDRGQLDVRDCCLREVLLMWGVRGLGVGKLGDARVLLGMSGKRECWRFGWIFAFLMLSLQLLSSNLKKFVDSTP